MFYKEWEVFIVDDEPDVLSVSKLTLQDINVFGLPLRLTTAQSKAEAIEYLESRPYVEYDLAVALVDVVMENDSAGLELCQYIRETMDNQLSQIYIRTGQPGVAPERAVIDRYDISGYFTKYEATEDKLYSLVKAGVRQFLWSTMSYGVLETLEGVIVGLGSSGQLWQQQMQLTDGMGTGFAPLWSDDPELGIYLLINGQLLDQGQVTDAARIQTLYNHLDQVASIPLGPHGDKYAREDNTQLIKVTAAAERAELACLLRMAFTPPIEIISLLHRALVGMAIAWK